LGIYGTEYLKIWNIAYLDARDCRSSSPREPRIMSFDHAEKPPSTRAILLPVHKKKELNMTVISYTGESEIHPFQTIDMPCEMFREISPAVLWVIWRRRRRRMRGKRE
jgi:hypothetical protein